MGSVVDHSVDAVDYACLVSTQPVGSTQPRPRSTRRPRGPREQVALDKAKEANLVDHEVPRPRPRSRWLASVPPH